MRTIFKFAEFTFQENALIRGIFTHASPHLKLAPKFLLSRPRQKEITHLPRQHSFENLLYQNSVRKYEDDLEHQVFYILYDLQFFSNVMVLQFCQQYLSYSMVLTLLLLLCNHDNLILKLGTSEKIATLLKGGFLLVISKLEVY